jgi:hypothetical protein
MADLGEDHADEDALHKNGSNAVDAHHAGRQPAVPDGVCAVPNGLLRFNGELEGTLEGVKANEAGVLPPAMAPARLFCIFIIGSFSVNIA